MKKTSYVTHLIAVLCSAFVVTITSHTAHAQTEYFVTVNPSNGIHTKIDSIPTVKTVQIGPSTSTIDKLTNHYFFLGKTASTNHLFTMNASNGSVISNPVFPPPGSPYSNAGGFEFDNSSGLIFGLAWNPTVSREYFIKIAPATGTIVFATVIPGVTGIAVGQNTYDQNGKRYFFHGIDSAGTNRFYTINATNGSVISMPVIAASTLTPFSARYNNATNKLYAIFNFSTGKELVQLNPLNLTAGTVATFTDMTSIAVMPNYATIDEINGRFTFLFMGASNTKKLYSVNLSNGNVVLNPSFPVGLATGENVVELRYNNTSGVLYGLHWSTTAPVPTGISEDKKDRGLFTVYPNPFSHSTSIVFSDVYDEASIVITNSLGQVIKKSVVSKAASAELNAEGMAPGLYFVTVLTEKGTSVKRVIVN